MWAELDEVGEDSEEEEDEEGEDGEDQDDQPGKRCIPQLPFVLVTHVSPNRPPHVCAVLSALLLFVPFLLSFRFNLALQVSFFVFCADILGAIMKAILGGKMLTTKHASQMHAILKSHQDTIDKAIK